MRVPRQPASLRTGDLAVARRSVVAKLLTAPLVALAWLVAARVVIHDLGVEGYAAYAVVAGIAVLIPFADLGTGAAVMDAMARRGEAGAADVEGVLVTSLRTLSVTAVVVIGVALSVAAAGLWTTGLGLPGAGSTNLGVGLAITVFAIGLPFGLGPRLLIGAGKNDVAVLFQALSALLMVTYVGAVSLLSAAPVFYFVAPFVSMAIANCIALTYATRTFAIDMRGVAARVMRRNYRGSPVKHIAGPMFVVTLVIPLAYQSDRIVLSHASELSAVAEYSIAFQLFSPLLGLISTAGIALWPVFARDRAVGSSGVSRQRLFRAQGAYGAFGLGLGVALLLLGPPLAELVSGGEVAVSMAIFWAFAGLLLLEATSYPIAMLLTDQAGLRFQAHLHVAMLAVNLPASILLARAMGAEGPVVGSIVAILVVLFVPRFVRAIRMTSWATT